MTETVETRWEAHNEAGRRFFSQSEYAQAEQEFIAAIREATLLGADNARLATSLSNLAQLKYRQKDLAQAEALFRRSLAIRERVLGGDHVGLVQNINNLAALHYARGELAQAEPLFRRALEISEKDLGDKHPDAAVTLSNLARLYFRKNDFGAAAPLLLRLLSIKEDTLGPNHPEVTAIVASLAKVRAAEGDLNAAEQLSRRALAAKETVAKPDDPSLAPSLEALADVLAGRGKHDEETTLRQRAARLRGGSPNAIPAANPAASLTVELRPPTAESPATPSKPAEPVLRSGGAGASGQRTSAGARVHADQSAKSPTPTTGTTGRVTRPSGSVSRSTERTEPRTGPVREPTTKSTTLPWIEPPTSPALRRPMPPRAPEPAAPVSGPTATTTAPESEMVTRFAPPSPTQLAKPEAASPTVRHATVERPHHAPAPAAAIESTEEPTEETVDEFEYAAAPRRGWVRVLAAAVVVLVAGAGSWALFMDHPATPRDATVSATSGSVALKTKAAPPTAAENNVSSRPVDPPSAPPISQSAQMPPAASQSTESHAAASRPEQLHETPPKPTSSKAVEAKPVESKPPVHTQARSANAAPTETDSTAAPHAGLPTIDVNAVTNNISARAKQRVDSLGRTMTVKPPSFDKPKDQP
ncbi:MAG TPA: tetratricopeptide repeat protein [Gemmatimonadaceae bacterium]|jgi:hypothetical protein